MGGITIDIDTGGTFTDAFVQGGGSSSVVKVPTTPHDLLVCFRQVLEKAAAESGTTLPDLLKRTLAVRYSTTVGTNTVIEGTGPRLGLLAPPGRDLSALAWLVPGGLTRAAGPGESELAIVGPVRELLAAGARGLVCSLDSAGAERRVRAVFRSHYPPHCLDAVPLLLGSEISAAPDWQLRTVTALFNAYLHPAMADCLYRAEDFLRSNGYRRPLLIMHNDGGCRRVAKTVAARTYHSGPLAGLLGAREVASWYGLNSLVTFDMGGTSLDAGFVGPGQAPTVRPAEAVGVTVDLELPDVIAIGAGGGSIASLEDGQLRVGPRSAGARPGPACYGLGGVAPTVTDANVALGLMDTRKFLGGSMRADRALAERALASLGSDPAEAALRVRGQVADNIAVVYRREFAARGIEPGRATLLAYGGAGPAHAADVAARLGIGRVLTLPFAAAFSAFGASTADVIHSYQGDPDQAAELRERALLDMSGEGYPASEVQVDMTSADGTLTCRARSRLPHLVPRPEPAPPSRPASTGQATVRWPGAARLVTATYERETLAPGSSLTGPALIAGPDTTYVVPPGWRLEVDRFSSAWLLAEGEHPA